MSGTRSGEKAIPPVQKVCSAGAVLFRQGTQPQEVYFLESGLIKLVHSEPSGRDTIVDLRYPGWFVGASAAILEQSHPVTAVAVMPSCLRHIARDNFRSLLKNDSRFSWQLHLGYSRETYRYAAQVAELGFGSARQRLEHLLWELLAITPGAESLRLVRLKLPLKHWEIAEIVAVTPEHLSRILKQLRQEGVIGSIEGSLVAIDTNKLWRPVDVDMAPCHKRVA